MIVISRLIARKDYINTVGLFSLELHQVTPIVIGNFNQSATVKFQPGIDHRSLVVNSL